MRRLIADLRWQPGRGGDGWAGAGIPEWRARLNQVRSLRFPRWPR